MYSISLHTLKKNTWAPISDYVPVCHVCIVDDFSTSIAPDV